MCQRSYHIKYSLIFICVFSLSLHPFPAGHEQLIDGHCTIQIGTIYFFFISNAYCTEFVRIRAGEFFIIRWYESCSVRPMLLCVSVSQASVYFISIWYLEWDTFFLQFYLFKENIKKKSAALFAVFMFHAFCVHMQNCLWIMYFRIRDTGWECIKKK